MSYVVNFELVANLATAWKLLVTSRTILVALVTVSFAVSSADRQLKYFEQSIVNPEFLGLSSCTGIRVVSNAGGINPLACGAALGNLAQKAGIDLNIAVITGDDLMGRTDEFRQSGVKTMDGGGKLPSAVQSMNAYLGWGYLDHCPLLSNKARFS